VLLDSFVNDYSPILLAEDDEDDIFMMRRALRQAGIANPLQIVRNGQEAIWYLKGEGMYADRKTYPWPCLMLLDLRMPLMDGFDVLAWLQRRRRPKDLLVVILSSSQHETDVLRVSELGADAYYAKPQAFDDLVALGVQLKERLDKLPGVPTWLTPPSAEARL
jgi:CheY-like chemotaxis protein